MLPGMVGNGPGGVTEKGSRLARNPHGIQQRPRAAQHLLCSSESHAPLDLNCNVQREVALHNEWLHVDQVHFSGRRVVPMADHVSDCLSGTLRSVNRDQNPVSGGESLLCRSIDAPGGRSDSFLRTGNLSASVGAARVVVHRSSILPLLAVGPRAFGSRGVALRQRTRAAASKAETRGSRLVLPANAGQPPGSMLPRRGQLEKLLQAHYCVSTPDTVRTPRAPR